MAIVSMMRKLGSVVAIPARTAPIGPASLMPIKMEILTAKTPGSDCVSASKSINSSSSSQWYFSTTVSRIISIIAYPPPKVKPPMTKKELQSLQRSRGRVSSFASLVSEVIRDQLSKLSQRINTGRSVRIAFFIGVSSPLLRSRL